MTNGSIASARRERRSGALRVGVLIVVLLVAAEVAVRAVEDKLQPPLQWHEYEAQVKAEQIEDLSRRGGVPIVAIGTSAMHFAFDPVRFRSEVSGSPIAYNAALPGGIPRIMEIWSERFVLPKLHPKLVVLGINSTDVNDAGTQGFFYDVFADSPAVKRLTGRSSVLQTIDYHLSTWSALWRFRTAIRQPVTFLRELRGRRPLTPGDGIRNLGVDISRRRRVLDATPQRVENFVNRRRRTWLRNFTIGNVEGGAFRRMVEDIRGRGITLVIVEMPVGYYYVRAHPRGEQDYATFKQWLSGVVKDTGSLFLDASRSVAPTPDYFSDFSHMNGKGQTAFTNFLAAQLRDRGLV